MATKLKAGIMLVLPWSLKHVGGVNEVVKSLMTRLGRDEELNGVLMICSQDRDEDYDRQQRFQTVYEPLPGPLESGPAFRSVLSFVLRLPQRLLALRRLIETNRVQCVNAHFPNLGALHFCLLRLLGLWKGSLVLSFHLSDATSAAATKGLERKLWGLLLGQADAIVIPSSDLGKVLLEVNPACAPAILTVPNGVDYPLFHQPQPLPENWPAVLRGRRVIVSVGGFEPRKGHALLLEAVSKLKKDYPDLGLVIIGTDRPERRDLEAQRAALGLEQDAFFYTGIPHDQLGAYLQQGFLFALATESETFCLAILEAGAAGLPVISTIAPGVVEVIENGITGRLVPVGNVEALEKAVRQVIEESELTAHMKQEFARRIQANWTLDHQYKHYKDLYRRLK